MPRLLKNLHRRKVQHSAAGEEREGHHSVPGVVNATQHSACSVMSGGEHTQVLGTEEVRPSTPGEANNHIPSVSWEITDIASILGPETATRRLASQAAKKAQLLLCLGIRDSRHFIVGVGKETQDLLFLEITKSQLSR